MSKILREKNEALEKADHLKSEFLTHITTELREPLNSVVGFAEIMKSQYHGMVNKEQSDYLDKIINSSNKLLDIVNNIIYLVKIEAQKIQLAPESVSLHKFLGDIVGSIKVNTKHKPKITLRCPKSIGDVYLDKLKIKHALANILTNAINFTPDDGEVVLSVKKTDSDIIISIRDNGKGLSAKEQKNAFGKFTVNHKHSGIGLGLPLVKALIELHSGSIAIHSAPNKGTIVECHLPLKPVKALAESG